MGSFSAWHWLILLAMVLVLFGRGRIPALLSDIAVVITTLKNGVARDKINEPSEDVSANKTN